MIDFGGLAERGAAHQPGALALLDVDRGVSVTFGSLASRVDRLSAALRVTLGVEVRDRVAVLSENCVEYFELYLACARSGAMLFPLNWRFSASQVAESLRSSTPKVVFYDQQFADVVIEVRGQLDGIEWVEWSHGDESEYEELFHRGPPSGDLVFPTLTESMSLPYLAVSTGGTTGIPKNAVHTQWSYSACAMDYLAAARIAPTDKYLMLGQLFHVIGYMPLAYLAMGRPVIIAEFNADPLVEVIRQEQISGFMAIATMLPRLVNAVKAAGVDTPSVRQVEYGGAPMGAEVIREAGEVFGADLMQAWGMTELGPGTYLSPLAHRRALSGERPELLKSCGQAALLSTVAVLDEAGDQVPQDRATMGEVCHRGPNNMLGYWNQPDETAEMIRDGWVHSGDVGIWDDEGFIYIVDRIKSMIISGGENIFPGEIERTLGNHPRIAEVVVIGVPDSEWGEVVKAVVVRAPDSTITQSEVADYVGEHLASYKKPRIVDFVDELPMTPTGKVNRALLSKPAGT